MVVLSSPYEYGDITIGELIPLFFRFVNLGLKFVYITFTYPFSSTNYSLRRVLWRTFVQTICPNSTFRQMQWVCPRTGDLYEKYMQSQPGRPPIVHEDIGVEGASLHWIGPKKAENVMLFFHGGGYVLPAVEGHFALVDHWRKEVKKRYGISMSVAVLEYSLSNHAPWPTQLVQTIASLNHLLKEGYDPSNIILAGDSVGGHQVNFVLAHLMHPHPNAPEIKLSKPLAGAAMLSPWLCYAQTAPSFTRNAKSDLLPVETLHAWSEQIVQTRQTTDDGYFFEPAYSPPEWWAGLGNVVRSVLFTTGSNECMFDDIVATAHRMEKGAGSDAKLECFVQHGASHNEALVEMACGDAPGPTSERVTTWIDSVLK